MKNIILKLVFLCLYMYMANGEEPCPKKLSALTQFQVQFLQCITSHAVPVSMCIGCETQHTNMLEKYDTLVASCSDVYFDKDRINMIASAQSSLVSLWTKAYCDDCFNNNNSLIFNRKNVTFYDCMHKTKKESQCEKCKLQYMDLNSFYINLDQHNNGEVCFDLQDSMNRTRNLWSKELNCCRREYNMTLFTIALCLIGSLPILFYTSTYFITKYQEQRQQRVLYDDPLYNSTSPSTSGRPQTNNLNRPTTSSSSVSSSTSAAANNNNLLSDPKANNTSIPQNNYNILNEDLDSSDDDEPIISTVNKDKIK